MIRVTGGTLALHGRQGDSYIIPIKGLDGKRLPLPMIQYFCRVFLNYARLHASDQFGLTVIGGGKHSQIAPFFDHAPLNVSLPYEFMY